MTIQSPLKDGLYIRPIRPNRRWIRYFVKNYHYLIGIMLSLIILISLLSVAIDNMDKTVLISIFLSVYWVYFLVRIFLKNNSKLETYYHRTIFQAIRILLLIVFITGFLFYIYNNTTYLQKVQTDTLWLLYFPIITAVSHRGSRVIFTSTLALIIVCLFVVHTIPLSDTGLSPWNILWGFLIKGIWITFLSGTSYILLRYMSDAVADLNFNYQCPKQDARNGRVAPSIKSSIG